MWFLAWKINRVSGDHTTVEVREIFPLSQLWGEDILSEIVEIYSVSLFNTAFKEFREIFIIFKLFRKQRNLIDKNRNKLCDHGMDVITKATTVTWLQKQFGNCQTTYTVMLLLWIWNVKSKTTLRKQLKHNIKRYTRKSLQWTIIFLLTCNLSMGTLACSNGRPFRHDGWLHFRVSYL